MSLLRHRVLQPLPSAPAALRRQPRAAGRAPAACDLLAPLLYLWLCTGIIASLLFPALRGSDPLIGWWPFWLLLWPATSMVLLVACRRQRLPYARRLH
ncbi:hypothetical protein [Aquimonas voraii]|uniref:Uncharacterized protein n=1 Tax=Aquimonas voraii TaxID=265719 RepID=A0A1G6WCC4_9GAMM|nr:hypothetical protein [Aquimonas voraii]SDD62696.1 hypothetical protein SAMN04488509_104208 [Aquimonas voraii]